MGDGAALDRAITLHRQATACIPVEDPFNVNCAANLGEGLRERFDRSAAAEDLIDALTAFRTAVESAAATDVRSLALTCEDGPDWRSPLVTDCGRRAGVFGGQTGAVMVDDISAADIALLFPFGSPDGGVSRASDAYLSAAVFVASACRRFVNVRCRAKGTAP